MSVTMRADISIVIPAFNRADRIKNCITSVLGQSMSPREIIVVDDCSTDNTVEVIRTFQDPRIRCIRQDFNSGAQVARNRGIREANGEWIAFLDSDDEWVPEKIERQFSALKSVNFDRMTVVHSDCYRFDQASGRMEGCLLPLVDGDYVTNVLLSSTGPMFQGMLTSKEALQAIGLLDETVLSYQEWDSAIMLSTICRFIHIREPLFIYHLHGGETISKDKLRDIRGYQYVVDKHRDEIIKYCGVEILNQHIIRNAKRALNWGYFGEATETLAKAVGNSGPVLLLKSLAKQKISFDSYCRSSALLRTSRLLLAYMHGILHAPN